MRDDTNKLHEYFSLMDSTKFNWQKEENLYLSSTGQIMRLSQKLRQPKFEMKAAVQFYHWYEYKSAYLKAFDHENQALALARKLHDQMEVIHTLGHLANTYIFVGDYEKALSTYQLSLDYTRNLSSKERPVMSSGLYSAIARLYSEYLKKYTAALPYDRLAMEAIGQEKTTTTYFYACYHTAYDNMMLKRYDTAYRYCQLILSNKSARNDQSYCYINSVLGAMYRDAPDSLLRKWKIDPAQRLQLAGKHFDIALAMVEKDHFLPVLTPALKERAELYGLEGNFNQAYHYYRRYIACRDSLENEDAKKTIVQKQFHADFDKRTDSLRFQERLGRTQLHAKQVQSYYFIGGIVLLFALSLVIWKNYRQQKHSNLLLAKTLADLKGAQQQLIQTEKMASLGELTAGIAHEIQNPLNFVNNFAEVSRELVTELNGELDRGDLNEVRVIADDIAQNLEKINHHGKRADGIVKGMLEHSRSSSGKKEPADINKLADEYLRLAFHGMRAKDKSFNAELVTHFDPALPEVLIVSQDIGRVLLNVFNNAFYATQQKRKTAGEDYRPLVTVETVYLDSKVKIGISDNGTGISDPIIDKIMQPFFTTKPTGEGTGLGLSLSYDIVVKGHSGAIDVRSVAGEGATFTISLSLN